VNASFMSGRESVLHLGPGAIVGGTDTDLLALCACYMEYDAPLRRWDAYEISMADDEAAVLVQARGHVMVQIVDIPATTDAGRHAKAAVAYLASRDLGVIESEKLNTLIRDALRDLIGERLT
jgi:hypothetical protein